AFPKARFHLIGHCFGCKVWLECLREPKLPRAVDTLVLLQGAVSDQCFAKSLSELGGGPGAYAEVPGRVNGPVVITFTKNDHALWVAYPAASGIGGQFAEAPEKVRGKEIGLYTALGGKGVEGIKPVPMKKAGDAYTFATGLNTVNAEEFIKAHSDIRHA